MIFTAVQVLRAQTSSQDFKSHGAEGLAPAIVSSTRIIGIPSEPIGFARRQRLQEHLGRYTALIAGATTGSLSTPFLGDHTNQRKNPFAKRQVCLTALAGSRGVTLRMLI